MGKPVGSDVRQGTITLPVICLREILSPDEFRAAFAEDDRSAVVDLVRPRRRSSGPRPRPIDCWPRRGRRWPRPSRRTARDALEALTHYVVERRV